MALLDLWRAYLQVQVHESLLAYQRVLIKRERYCLTRLGFGLIKCGADDHEGYRQYSVGIRGKDDEGDIILHR